MGIHSITVRGRRKKDRTQRTDGIGKREGWHGMIRGFPPLLLLLCYSERDARISAAANFHLLLLPNPRSRASPCLVCTENCTSKLTPRTPTCTCNEIQPPQAREFPFSQCPTLISVRSQNFFPANQVNDPENSLTNHQSNAIWPKIKVIFDLLKIIIPLIGSLRIKEAYSHLFVQFFCDFFSLEFLQFNNNLLTKNIECLQS